MPIWIRLPKPRCLYTGLCKSAINALILGVHPKVKSVSLRQRHAIRGTRLILLSSLLDYIAGVAEAQINPTDQSASGKPKQTRSQRRGQ